MKEKIKIAFIVPVFNVNNYLFECLNSLIQIETPKEIIIVDDKGAEDPYKIIDMFSSHEKFKIVKNSENLGLGFARNEGLKLISPDTTHVFFVDSDDYVSPKEIDAVASKIEVGETALMKSYWNFTKKSRNEIVVKDYTLSDYPYVVGGCFGNAETCKKTQFRSRIYEDAPWVLDYFENLVKDDLLNKCIGFDEKTYFYRNRLSSISKSKRSEVMLLAHINSLLKIHDSNLYGGNYSKTELLFFEYLKLSKDNREKVSLSTVKISVICKMWIYFAFYMQKITKFNHFSNRKLKNMFFE